MQRVQLARRPRGELELDLCIDCRGIWFDQFESSQLTPGAVQSLVEVIQRKPVEGHAIRHERLHCPRCADRLIHGADLSKNGHFAYDRCPHWHGRFTTFAAFLLEKGIVRQLAQAERKALAIEVGALQCPNCGAPLDIQHRAACQYCGTRITALERRDRREVVSRSRDDWA